MPDKNIKPLLKETYLAFIKNSIGSRSFKNFYSKINKKKQDVLNDGELSCAFFVSTIVTIFGLSKKIHTTVNSTVDDLLKFGWVEVRRPRIGAVLVWESLNFE